jgi:hypothetical protein
MYEAGSQTAYRDIPIWVRKHEPENDPKNCLRNGNKM